MTTFTPQVRIECGDALMLLRREPSASVDLCVTSPPYADLVDYGAGVRGCLPHRYTDWLLPILDEIGRVLRPGAALALNLGWKHGTDYVDETILAAQRRLGYTVWERVAWVKPNPAPTADRERHLVPSWEPIYVLSRGVPPFCRDAIRVPYEGRPRDVSNRTLTVGHHGGRRAYARADKPAPARNPLGKDAGNVLIAAPETSPRWPHPARFPEAVPAFFIRAYCPDGGTVLDPFAGSGTTLAVSARLGRNAIGFDLNPAFVAMARRRVVADAQPRLALDAAAE